MTQDAKLPTRHRTSGARPLPDLGGVALSDLAELDDPALVACVDELLDGTEEDGQVRRGSAWEPTSFGQVWCGGPIEPSGPTRTPGQ